MVAVCAPSYYDPAHEWCGLEWATMQTLGETRLRQQKETAIIPVTIRTTDHLPPAVTHIQQIDFTGITTQSYYYFRTHEFREKVEEIARKILHVAETIQKNRAKPKCDKFVYPTISAFDGYIPETPSFPFYKV
jgi:hypothetical protein